MISNLGGFYVKSAQILASKKEYIPHQWCERLSALWDNMQPRPYRRVQRGIQRDLQPCDLARDPGFWRVVADFEEFKQETRSGRLLARAGHAVRNAAAGKRPGTRKLNIRDVFESVDETPLAAASIAQVR